MNNLYVMLIFYLSDRNFGVMTLQKRSTYFVLALLPMLLILPSAPADSFAQDSDSEIIPLGNDIAIEKTVLKMNIPENNQLPWGFVEGKISNHVPDYPVIIQIFDDDSKVSGNNIGALHFAQTEVSGDGTYEYKFRVLDKNGDGDVVKIFSGDYTVKVFKVIYLHSNAA